MSAYKLIFILLGIIDLGHLKLFFSQAEFLGTHQVLYTSFSPFAVEPVNFLRMV
jgi:hypothetical protein